MTRHEPMREQRSISAADYLRCVAEGAAHNAAVLARTPATTPETPRGASAGARPGKRAAEGRGASLGDPGGFGERGGEG